MVDLVTFSPQHKLNEGGMKTASEMFKTAPNDWVEPSGVAPVASRYANRTGSGYETFTLTDVRGGTYAVTAANVGVPAVDVEPGEASIGPAIIASDETRSLELPTQASDEPVYVAWNTNATDDIQVGVGADFPDNSWETLELCRVTTSDTAVTDLVDTRPVGMENAISHIGNTSDIQFKVVDSFDDTIGRDEGIIQVVRPERKWMRATPDGFREFVHWQKEGTMIEDWEDSGGTFGSAWNAWDAHAITGEAALDGGEWGFSSEGASQSTTSNGGLRAYPQTGSWFEFLFRWDDWPTDDRGRFQIRFGEDDSNAYYTDIRHVNGAADEIFLSSVDSSTTGNQAITTRSASPGEAFQKGRVYRVAIYVGGVSETWHLELFEFNLAGSDRLINSWTGTADYSHGRGWLSIDPITYGTDISVDRLRRPPRNPP